MNIQKKYLVLFIILIITSTFVITGAENHISVPLNNRVYSVLKSAEIRGLIDTGLEVRPYPTSKVIKLLQEIYSSSHISSSERSEIKNLLEEFGYKERENSFKNLVTFGSYQTYLEDFDILATMGIRLNFEYRQSLTNFKHIDSRNGGDIYLRGNIKNLVSFQMDIGMRFDHLDHRLFLKNDFTIPSEGKYDTFWDHGGEHTLYYGSYGSPEATISLMQGKFLFRWARIHRDWGVGLNNLMLGGSASPFNAAEMNLEITPWLRLSFLAGALGKFSISDAINIGDGFYEEYFFTDRLHDTQYDNNFTAQRVEIDLPFNIKFGIYESVIYRKRFEIGYLNPFAILMYEQNIMGDFDNVFAGFDAQWTLPNIMRVYGAIATTEMNEINPKRFFKAPRNIMAIQAGVDFNVPILNFSTATFQYTYLGPFFYTHKPIMDEENDWDVLYELSMVNEGRNLGYPLRPNSDEFLFRLNFNFKENWDGFLSFKYQRRSGQYGFNIDKFMYYRAANNGAYEDKDFNNNIFEKAIGIEAKVNKTLKSSPIRLSISYLVNLETKRVNDLIPVEAWDMVEDEIVDDKDLTSAPYNKYSRYPIVEYKVEGPWESWKFSHALRLSANIWF